MVIILVVRLDGEWWFCWSGREGLEGVEEVRLEYLLWWGGVGGFYFRLILYRGCWLG